MHATPGIQRGLFGQTPQGQPVEIFTLVNRNGVRARLTPYGAMLTELHVPDRAGRLADIVLGFPTLEGYLRGHPYFGCTTGRVANRIARGTFTLDGRTHTLATNNGPNHLHGGRQGLDKRLWQAQARPADLGPAVLFSYHSPHDEEGYPGNLAIDVLYSLTHANELRIDYTATTDQPTAVNLTNHSYFNLRDAGRSPIYGHLLQIQADFYTPVDDALIPTGEIRALPDPLTFRQPTPIGTRLAQLPGPPPGYDHNYVLRKAQPESLELAARVHEPDSGRVLEILTTQPGIQLYTGNFLDGSLTGKEGIVYRQHHGFCLETQHFPDSVNHAHFPSTILRPGQTYRQTTVHRFSAR